MSDLLHGALRAYNGFVLVYLALLAVVSTGLAIVGWRAVENYVRRRPMRDYRWVGESPMSLPVTILMPAYNEGPVIVAAIRSLLITQFLNFEILVINDGSTDDTLERLQDGFDLMATSRVPRAHLEAKPVRGVYVSAVDPRITVLDKVNGGKADALNAGLRFARNPLVCAIDADSMLDPGALSRLVWEFQSDPETVATGGIVRILNGSEVEASRLVKIHTPRSPLVNIQIMEYLRGFLGARIGWSRLQMLLIISGAFGLFRRDAIIDIGGYATDTVGEDAEIILRLHRQRREQGLPCRVTFFPDPICWTEAPSDLRTLVRQRDRWQRGMIEMLVKHRTMLFNPRYGRIGMVALPYFLFFGVLGPLIELTGMFVLTVSYAMGLTTPRGLVFTAALAISYGFVLSFLTIFMEERAFRRYPGWKCLRRLGIAAVVENLGYRQLMLLVQARALLTVRRSRGSWGEMTRTGFGEQPVPAPTSV